MNERTNRRHELGGGTERRERAQGWRAEVEGAYMEAGSWYENNQRLLSLQHLPAGMPLKRKQMPGWEMRL